MLTEQTKNELYVGINTRLEEALAEAVRNEDFKKFLGPTAAKFLRGQLVDGELEGAIEGYAHEWTEQFLSVLDGLLVWEGPPHGGLPENGRS